MAKLRGMKWSHDELLVAMNLYCQLPFGQLHHRNKLIVEVSAKMGRTPASLAMKLCNLASLDPIHAGRGVVGLKGASQGDRAIWCEFNANPTSFALESQKRYEELVQGMGQEPDTVEQQDKRTEKEYLVTQRLGQTFFRKTVLSSYNSQCCITSMPVPELLRASHILPWAQFPQHRLDPRNGLCLAATHDAAFDKGLITFDQNLRLVISRYLKECLVASETSSFFSAYEGKPLLLPQKFPPSQEFLKIHRDSIFRG